MDAANITYRLMLTISISALLSACAGAIDRASTARVESDLAVMEFNSIASKYMERPTFVQVSQLIGGPQILLVEYDAYGMYSGYEKIYRADQAVLINGYINKYLEWAKEASKHGDLIDKEIGMAKAMGGAPIRLSIYSASSERHLLSVETCTLGICGEDKYVHYMDEKNAIKLSELLTSMANNTLKTQPSGSYQ